MNNQIWKATPDREDPNWVEVSSEGHTGFAKVVVRFEGDDKNSEELEEKLNLILRAPELKSENYKIRQRANLLEEVLLEVQRRMDFHINYALDEKNFREQVKAMRQSINLAMSSVI